MFTEPQWLLCFAASPLPFKFLFLLFNLFFCTSVVCQGAIPSTSLGLILSLDLPIYLASRNWFLEDPQARMQASWAATEIWSTPLIAHSPYNTSSKIYFSPWRLLRLYTADILMSTPKEMAGGPFPWELTKECTLLQSGWSQLKCTCLLGGASVHGRKYGYSHFCF